MAIPDYQSCMLPLLQVTEDGAEHRMRDLYGEVADKFELTDEERNELLPSGQMPVLNNRVQWAKLYLVRAGLLESPSRGVVCITDRGRKLLASDPQHLDVSTLKKFPEFIEFFESKRTSIERENERRPTQDAKTPDELLEVAHRQLTDALSKELLQLTLSLSPAFFEKLVIKLLIAMG